MRGLPACASRRFLMTIVPVVATLNALAPRPAATEMAVERFCSLAPMPLLPGPLDSFFLGYATALTVPASAGTISPSGYGGHAAPPPTGDSIWGQYFGVEVAGGARASELSQQEMVVLVFWDYDAGCEPTHYGGDRPMVVAGETVLVSGRLRHSRDWVGGVPTLDTFWGGSDVFPQSAMTEWRKYMDEIEADPQLPVWEQPTALEAWEFVSMLPTSCEDLLNPETMSAKLATVRAAYVRDERFEIRYTLDDFDRDVEWRREACLTGVTLMTRSILAPLALLLVVVGWHALPMGRRQVALRKLRSILVLGLVGAAFGYVTAPFGDTFWQLVLRKLDGMPIEPGFWQSAFQRIPMAVGDWMMLGAFTGSIFGTMLLATHRKHRLEDLSLGKVGVIVGIAGALFLIVYTGVQGDLSWLSDPGQWLFVGWTGTLGAGLTTGMVTLAKRAHHAREPSKVPFSR